MIEILLVDAHLDSFELVHESTYNLAELSWAKSIAEANKFIHEKKFDLIILDIDLPDGNGIDYCSYLQTAQHQLLIFMLSEHSGLAQKVLSFSAGADDYMTRPFSPLELRARLTTRLKKYQLYKSVTDIECWKEMKISKLKQEVFVLKDNIFQKVFLTALEFKIVSYMIIHIGEIIPRDQLLNDVWGVDVHVYQRSVDSQVSKLRKKFGSASYVLKSIRGIGYKFTPTLI